MIQHRPGDQLLIRGIVREDKERGLVFYFTPTNSWPLADLEVAVAETVAWQKGDRVIADGFAGEVLCVWPDGDLLWVKPDDGNRRPWTIEAAKCRREPVVETAEVTRLVPREAAE